MLKAARTRKKSDSFSATYRKRWKEDPDFAERMGKIHKDLWGNPAFRDKTTKAIKAATNTPEEKEKRRRRMRSVWENPIYRERFLAALKENWSDPNFRIRALALMLGGRTMPDRKARIKRVERLLEGLEATPDSIRSEEFIGRIKAVIRGLSKSISVDDVASEIWVAIAGDVKQGKILSDKQLAELIGNYVTNAINKEVGRRYREVSLDMPVGGKLTLKDVLGNTDQDPAEKIDQPMSENTLLALNAVEPTDRHVVSEVVIKERPIEEVARELNVSVGELQEKLGKALEALKKKLTENRG